MASQAPTTGSPCSPYFSDLVQPGEVVAPSSVFWTFFTQPCAVAPPAATEGLGLNRRGSTIPRSYFPLLAAHMEKAGGPSRMLWTLDGKPAFPVDGTASTGDEKSAPEGKCVRYTLRDGTTVCATWTQSSNPAQLLYADPKCENPVLVIHTDVCGTPPRPAWFPDINLSDYCGDFGMRQVLGLHTGPTYFGDTTTCTAHTDSDPADALYDLGPKVPAKDIAVSLEARPL
jgi:hypothetical protein